MAERSIELIEVGYYLSRFGISNPPERFDNVKWKEVYRMFYDSLSKGREVLEFEHSLKNTRDGYDSYFPENERSGWWKIKYSLPAKLPKLAQVVYDEFADKDELSIWNLISNYADPNYKVKAVIFEDLIAEDTAGSDDNTTRTEGGIKVRISKTLERSAKLRQQALDYHGYICQVCDFDFEKQYGKWGSQFAEVHHIKALFELGGENTLTDPKKDLSVLCANCHRMAHRKKGFTLTLDELRSKLKKTN
jgi:5-methylcytosine-specific restriction protein A